MLPVDVDRKAPLSDLYAPEMIAEIVSYRGGSDSAQRWGVAEDQLSLAALTRREVSPIRAPREPDPSSRYGSLFASSLQCGPCRSRKA